MNIVAELQSITYKGLIEVLRRIVREHNLRQVKLVSFKPNQAVELIFRFPYEQLNSKDSSMTGFTCLLLDS